MTGLRFLAAFTLATATVVSPSPADAQIAPGRSGTSSTQIIEDNGEFWRTLVAFGHCYAGSSAERAFALLATEPGSREEQETYRRLFARGMNSCLYGTSLINVGRAMVRGSIAEGLYRRRVAMPDHLVQAPLAPDASVRTLSEAARCYAASHRSEVEALVANSRAGSQREFDQLSEMADGFFRCLPESARGRSFEPTLIRYRLVEALLRMSPPGEVAAN